MMKAAFLLPLAAAASSAADPALFLNMIQYSSDDCSGAELSTIRFHW
jgi:hypothetical protein